MIYFFWKKYCQTIFLHLIIHLVLPPVIFFRITIFYLQYFILSFILCKRKKRELCIFYIITSFVYFVLPYISNIRKLIILFSVFLQYSVKSYSDCLLLLVHNLYLDIPELQLGNWQLHCHYLRFLDMQYLN